MENRGEKARKVSIIVMLLTLSSRILGIFKARVLAVVFGATLTGDILNFTFNIPNNFRKLFAEGALSSAYVPRFSAIMAEDGTRQRSKQLLAVLSGFQLIISLVLIVATLFFGQNFIRLISDYRQSEVLHLASRLLFCFMFFLAAISFSALYSGVLQSHGAFYVAAAAPLLFSVAIIGAVKLGEPFLGPYSMALGVVLGGALQMLVTRIALARFAYPLALSFNFKNREFVKVLRAWGPVTLIALTTILTQQIAFFLASTLQEGSVTAFSNAIIIWQAPYGIFYGAIATVYFPLMASTHAKGNREELRNLVAKGLSYLTVFLLPVTIALVTLRNETVAVLLQSGRFVLANTLATGTILLYFAIGMLAVAYYSFLQRVCFSIGKFKVALYFNFLVALLDIVAMLTFVKSGLGGAALSLANTIAFLMGSIGLALYLGKGGIFKLNKELVKIVGANLPLILLALLYRTKIDQSWWHTGSSLSNALKLTFLYGGAAILVLVLYSLLGIKVLSFRRRGPQLKGQ